MIPHNNFESNILVRNCKLDERPVIPSSVPIMTILPVMPLNISGSMVFRMPPFGPVVLLMPDRMPFLFVVTVGMARWFVKSIMGE